MFIRARRFVDSMFTKAKRFTDNMLAMLKPPIEVVHEWKDRFFILVFFII